MHTVASRIIGCVFFLLSAASAAHGYTPAFRDTECPIFIQQLAEDSSSEISCGYLIVPEDREATDSDRLLELFVVRIAARHSLGNAPLIYLAGGPGSPVAQRIPNILGSQLSKRYEIIAIDQRGAGFSRPSLNCFELDDRTRAADTDWIQDCYRRLRNDGIGLHAYRSADNAKDIHDLLVAVDIESANLYGVSYGSRLAMTIARDFPQRIRSLILDGVFPLHVNRFDEHALNGYQALERMFNSCAAAPDCRSAYPNLSQSFYEVIRSLNESPAAVLTLDKHSVLTGNDFATDVMSKLYDKNVIAFLPTQIDAFAQGEFAFSAEAEALNWGPAMQYWNEALDRLDGLSEGTWLSIRCADEAPFNSRVEIVNRASNLPGIVRRPLVQNAVDGLSMCETWKVPRAADLENRPVISDIPTLLLSGYFDPVTPPHWGDEAKRYLANSWHFVFRDSGHGVLFTANAECAELIALEFLSDPAREPTHDCLERLEPIRFYVREPG